MNKLQLELPLFEQWLPIEGYEDLYQVSNFGRIKSLERVANNNHLVKERILKQVTIKDGYKRICLCKDRKQKWFLVHRLVANAFISNPNNYDEVNHKDECKTNNHVSNLEWCDRKYNCNFGTRNERLSKTFSGENNPNAKQIIQLTLDGEVVKTWGSMMDVQRKLGYNNTNICSCCRGKRNYAHGYKWCYA